MGVCGRVCQCGHLCVSKCEYGGHGHVESRGQHWVSFLGTLISVTRSSTHLGSFMATLAGQQAVEVPLSLYVNSSGNVSMCSYTKLVCFGSGDGIQVLMHVQLALY